MATAPDYPEVLINLIDALRAYIETNERVGDELLHAEAITRAEYDEGIARSAPMVTMLEELEAHGIDPSLYGLIKRLDK